MKYEVVVVNEKGGPVRKRIPLVQKYEKTFSGVIVRHTYVPQIKSEKGGLV